MLGRGSQQLVSNPSYSGQHTGCEGVSAHAAGWSIPLQTGQDYSRYEALSSFGASPAAIA